MLHVFHFVPALALIFLLKDFENSSSSFIAHRSSMNRLTVWYLYGSADFLEIRIGTCSDSEKIIPRKDQVQYPQGLHLV